MDLTTLALLAVIGMALSGLALVPRSNGVVWATVALVVWSVFALGATNVEIFDAGVTHTRTYGSVALVGGVLALLNLYMMLLGTVDLFAPSDEDETERRAL